MLASEQRIVHKMHQTLDVYLQVVSTSFNAAFAPCVNVSVVTRHTLQLIPLLKAFYGCLHGRRAAVTGTRMGKEERAMEEYICICGRW